MREKSKCLDFRGIYSANSIPQKKLLSLPRFSIILNLSKMEEKGTHFICIIKVSNKDCFYLDPLALNFTLNSFIPSFIDRLKCKRLYSLKTPIQSINSTYCGWFGIYFCMLFDSYFDEVSLLPITKFSAKSPHMNDEICLQNIRSLISTEKS
jgi:hypothetical protein